MRNIGAAATDYLMALGYLCGGWQMASSAASVWQGHFSQGYSTEFLQTRLLLSAKYGVYMTPKIFARLLAVQRSVGLDAFPAHLV